MKILYVEHKNMFALQTPNTSYVFGVDNNGLLRHIYWGKKVLAVEDFDMPILTEVSTNDPVFEITNEEFPVHGGFRYKETCLSVTFFDGCRELVYEYVSHKIEENSLVITLKDKYYAFEFDLTYKIYEEDLIERFVTVRNTGIESVEINHIQSAQLHIPKQNLMFTNTYGHWGAEFLPTRQRVGFAKIRFENRRGISTHHHNPFFILDADATETTGEVYFGVLKQSGNFSGVVEQTQYGHTLVQMGLNHHDFKLTLKANESFVSPGVVFGYRANGFEEMTHDMNKYANRYVLRDGVRPVLYNSWEATEFDVSASQQIELAKKASELGVELFVVDDGWFGRRDSIEDGLGDWVVNPVKFPHGLEPLISEVKTMGMKFGIWIEPEMANPKSDLYREHPDWIYQYASRESDVSRGQYVLNLTKPEVKDFVYNMIDQLLSSHEIDYIKWDANRPISQSSIDQSIWVLHIRAVYDIVKALKVKHPHVLFEACASGGGRIDYGILEHFDDFWTSDNTDALDRLTIQKTYSYVYPIKAMRAWVTDCPNFLSKRTIPLAFRFHSAMLGTLGIGCNILNLTEEECELSQNMIETYKRLRLTIQEGAFYRLAVESLNEYEAYEYVHENEALLFVFLPQSKVGHASGRIKCRGLEETAIYSFELNHECHQKSGSYLMNHGIVVQLNGDYSSEIVTLKKVK